MKDFIREAAPFMGINEFTDGWSDRDWGNPFIVFLMPFIAFITLADILMLPLTSTIWLFRFSVLKTANFLHGKSDGDYYLNSRRIYSPISSHQIRSLFVKRMMDMGYNGRFDTYMSGCYENDDLQRRWEEFFNGFRLGEDSKL